MARSPLHRCPHRVARPRLALALVLAGAAAHGAEIYRWVDPAGGVHYSDRPTDPAARPVEVAPAPQPDPDADGRARRRERLLELFAEERAERKAAAQAERREREQRRRNCAAARERLANYEQAGYLYEESDDGERRILSDAEHDEVRRRAREAVEQWCD